MENIIKTVNASLTISSKILFPNYMNNEGILYGGQHLMWIDELAGIVAKRHCGNASQCVTTACVKEVNFYKPCYQNDIIEMKGFITYVGNSSMEICVETYTECQQSMKELVNRAYLVLVALDENRRPVKVPRLRLETEEERYNWDMALKRNNRSI